MGARLLMVVEGGMELSCETGNGGAETGTFQQTGRGAASP